MRAALTALVAVALFAVACGEDEIVSVDHQSAAVINGLVLELEAGIVVGVPVKVAAQGRDCVDLTPGAGLGADTTDANGRFEIVASVPLGPIGPGCVRLDSDLGPDYEALDTAALSVPVTFFQGVPTDTSRVVVQVRRR